MSKNEKFHQDLMITEEIYKVDSMNTHWQTSAGVLRKTTHRMNTQENVINVNFHLNFYD